MSLLKRIEQRQDPGRRRPERPARRWAADSRLEAWRNCASSWTRPRADRRRQRDWCRSTSTLKTAVQNKLLAELDPSMDVRKTEEVRTTIEDLYESILAEENIVLSRPERRACSSRSSQKSWALARSQPLLEDETITEIMVNGAKNIYIERNGKIHPRAGHL